jgi:hypothetical protein
VLADGCVEIGPQFGGDEDRLLHTRRGENTGSRGDPV